MGNLLRVILKASDGFLMLSWFARRRAADTYFVLVGTRWNSWKFGNVVRVGSFVQRKRNFRSKIEKRARR